MKRSVLKNFRGSQALVLVSEQAGCGILLRIFSGLGITAIVKAPEDVTGEDISSADLIFVDADEGSDPILESGSNCDAPLIAIIGSEAPSRLSRVIRARAASHIQKPIRNSGVFTAILLAMNEHAHRKRLEREASALRRRLAGRRKVVRAVLSLMTRWGVDEDEAYKMLRSAAMSDRIPVEEAAERLLRNRPEEPSSKRTKRSSD